MGAPEPIAPVADSLCKVVAEAVKDRADGEFVRPLRADVVYVRVCDAVDCMSVVLGVAVHEVVEGLVLRS